MTPNKKDKRLQKPFEWNFHAPLSRVEATDTHRGESLKAFQALLDFYAMGSGRSITKLHKRYLQRLEQEKVQPPSHDYRTICNWSNKHCWPQRVARAVDLDTLHFQEKLRERQLEVLLKDFEHSTKLREIVEEALKEAVRFVKENVKKYVDNEGNTVIVKTERLDGNLIARLEQLSSDLGRRATGLDTTRIEVKHDWQSEAEALGIDVGQLVQQLTENAVQIIEGELVDEADKRDGA